MTAIGKRLAIALGVSLTLNLFFLGFMTARMLHRPFEQGDMHGPFFGLHGLLSHGGPRGPADELIRDMMEHRRDAMHAQRGQLRDAQRAVRDALTSDPLDGKVLRQALDQLKRATADSQELVQAALIEIAPELSLEQRRQVARNGRAFGAWGGMDRR